MQLFNSLIINKCFLFLSASLVVSCLDCEVIAVNLGFVSVLFLKSITLFSSCCFLYYSIMLCLISHSPYYSLKILQAPNYPQCSRNLNYSPLLFRSISAALFILVSFVSLFILSNSLSLNYSIIILS